jgi:hypothetical protein
MTGESLTESGTDFLQTMAQAGPRNSPAAAADASASAPGDVWQALVHSLYERVEWEAVKRIIVEKFGELGELQVQTFQSTLDSAGTTPAIRRAQAHALKEFTDAYAEYQQDALRRGNKLSNDIGDDKSGPANTDPFQQNLVALLKISQPSVQSQPSVHSPLVDSQVGDYCGDSNRDILQREYTAAVLLLNGTMAQIAEAATVADLEVLELKRTLFQNTLVFWQGQVF